MPSLLTRVWMPGPCFLPGCGLGWVLECGSGGPVMRSGQWPRHHHLHQTGSSPHLHLHLLRLSRTHTHVHCWSPPLHSINLICSSVLPDYNEVRIRHPMLSLLPCCRLSQLLTFSRQFGPAQSGVQTSTRAFSGLKALLRYLCSTGDT